MLLRLVEPLVGVELPYYTMMGMIVLVHSEKRSALRVPSDKVPDIVFPPLHFSRVSVQAVSRSVTVGAPSFGFDRDVTDGSRVTHVLALFGTLITGDVSISH